MQSTTHEVPQESTPEAKELPRKTQQKESIRTPRHQEKLEKPDGAKKTHIRHKASAPGQAIIFNARPKPRQRKTHCTRKRKNSSRNMKATDKKLTTEISSGTN